MVIGKKKIQETRNKADITDRQGFASIVETYTDRIYRLLLRMTGEERDAEDLLQETFIKVYKNLAGFEGRSSLSTWIYRIAMNEALMLLRKKTPGGYSLDEEVENDSGEMTPREIASWDALPEELLLSDEMKRVLNTAVMSLTTTLRSVFLLRDIEKLSVKETAEAMDISEATVKVRLLRARLKLREKLSLYFIQHDKEEQS